MNKPTSTFMLANTNTGNLEASYQRCLAAGSGRGDGARRPEAIAPGGPSGEMWFDQGSQASRYCHTMPPILWNCAVGSTQAGKAAATASSHHPGVVNCAMTDGSIKVSKQTIARQTWWALGTRSNGEVISADSY